MRLRTTREIIADERAATEKAERERAKFRDIQCVWACRGVSADGNSGVNEDRVAVAGVGAHRFLAAISDPELLKPFHVGANTAFGALVFCHEDAGYFGKKQSNRFVIVPAFDTWDGEKGIFYYAGFMPDAPFKVVVKTHPVDGGTAASEFERPSTKGMLFAEDGVFKGTQLFTGLPDLAGKVMRQPDIQPKAVHNGRMFVTWGL
jgi:hypothetical protein